MQRSGGGRLLAPLAQAMARWAGGGAPSTASAASPSGFAGVGFVRRSGTFPKDTSKDKGDNIDVRFRDGSRNIVKHLRKDRRIPAILFGPGDNQGELLSLPLADIERQVRKYGIRGVGSKILTLRFEGGNRTETVIAKELTQDAGTRIVENVCFMPCGPETIVKIKVPVRTEGEDSCPGIKRGGFAWKLQKTLTVVCKGKDIPLEFMIDISKMEVDDKIFLKDVIIPEGVEVKMKDEKIPIVKLNGKGR